VKLQIELSQKQTQAFQLLSDDKISVLVFGGAAGGGKSWLGCSWQIARRLAYPNTRGFICRQQIKDIVNSTFKTFKKVSNEMSVNHLWTYNDLRKTIYFSNGSELLLIEAKMKPGDAMFERLGSTEYTDGFIDEATELHFDAYDGLSSRIGREHNEEYGLIPKLLMTCNPKKTWIYNLFYKPYVNGTLDPEYAFIQSFVDDNPKISSHYKTKLEKLKSDIMRERLLHGNWDYEAEPDQLIIYEWVEACFTASQDVFSSRMCSATQNVGDVG